MDVSSAVLAKEVILEEKSEEEDSVQTPLVSNTMEPTTSLEESIISLHALLGI
jgi:hypothetical protein